MQPHRIEEATRYKKGDGFKATPYSEYYNSEHVEIADTLDKAAGLTTNKSFKTYLESRARAFRTNEYRQSDVNWVKSLGSPFEFNIGPYENYLDKLFGVKRDHEAMVGVVLGVETKEAKLYRSLVVAQYIFRRVALYDK